MTVKELINELLECNMESEVKVILGFSDVNIVIDEDISEVSATVHNFEDAIINIDIRSKYDEWI